jgi:putative transposase
MMIRKAFKFRLKPNSEQRMKLAQTAGCVRLVWNKSLAAVKEGLDKKEGYKGYCQMAGEMKGWKKEESTSFLKLVHSQPLQQTLKDLDRAIRDGFKKEKGFPHFKKKNTDKAFRYPQGVRIDGDQAYLPKIGFVKFQKSQEIIGIIKNTTISFYCGHWYISFQTEFEQDIPKHQGDEIGIDMGITHFAALSDQTTIEAPRPLKKYEKKLAAAQKALNRKLKGGKNYTEQKYRVQRIHKKIADIRRDFLHKTSTKLCKNHARIVIEDLQVANMSKSAKGTVEEPGRQVKAKSGLNKSILDQGWYEFRRQLEYKSAWLGGEVISVSPRNTSRKCSSCGHTEKENRKTQSNFACMCCGLQLNADFNASINILAAGRAVVACGDIRPVAV